MSGRVSFKMPFDELRGKLATKQNGILYESQEQGQNLATLRGKKMATNFDKYIVAYKRRGVPRFFIKSNTAVNQTSLMRRQKGAFAAAQYLWEWLSKTTPAGGSFANSMRVWAERYAVAMGKSYTPREYFVAIATAAITARQQEIQFPNYLQDEPTMERGIANPFYSTNVYNTAWNGEILATYESYIQASALKSKGLAQVLRDYADAFFSTILLNVTLNIEGVDRQIILNAPAGVKTFQDYDATPYAKALRLNMELPVKMLAFDAKTGKLISGSPFTIFTNADKTTAVTAETNINADLVLYA